MPKQLIQGRPRSSISDLVDSSLISKTEPAVSEKLDLQEKPVATGKQERDEVSTIQKVPPVQQERTGEHTNIQKMFRLTPSAYRALKELASIFSEVYGFEVTNSAMVRVLLRMAQSALPDVERYAQEHLAQRSRPSTAIGCEQARDDLEAEIADAINATFKR